jgi:DNA polymerase eta
MELGYTCSVGIATNKLLAKIASAKNKPDRQTLIPPRAVPGLMQMLPLRKIKLLGGKLGEEMKQKWGCLTAGDAQQIPQAELMACFGERLGTYAWKAVRGFQADKGDHTGH